MTMHAVYSKEREGIVQNPVGSLASVPWWSGLGSQSAYGESFGQLKSSSLEHPATGDQLASTKQAGRSVEQGLENANATQFTIFPGDCKSSANRPKPPQLQAAISMESAPPEYQGGFDIGFGQPVICAKYPYGDQCYGIFSTYGPQITGRIMLPLNLTNDEGPIFVNAKQYHGIIRRRQSRAKAELKNKVLRDRKPYLHLSRHLHAMRRPRGCGGRFLNTKTLNGDKEAKSSESQNSEVLQSDSGNLNSPKEANGTRSNISGSEATSMYTRNALHSFSINHLGPSVHSLPDMMNAGHGIFMPRKWIPAADNCCNLKV